MDEESIISFFDQLAVSAGLGPQKSVGEHLDISGCDELRLGVCGLNIQKIGAQVHILFGAPVSAVGMTVEQARQLAHNLRITARQCEVAVDKNLRKNRAKKRAKRRRRR